MPQSRSDFLERLGRDPADPGRPAAPQPPWQWQYAKPGPYTTQLNPQEEAQFQQWVKTNKVPFDPSPTADYDMRGFWKFGGATRINPVDRQLHFTDKYKTPYHHSFSGESMYANPATNPPTWKDNQLVDQTGRVLFDEQMAAPKPWTSATANLPKVQTVPVRATQAQPPQGAGQFPGMQGMIPAGAQIMSPQERAGMMLRQAKEKSAAFQAKPFNEKLGRTEAAVLGMDYDKQKEMADRGLLMQLIAFHGSPYAFEQFDVSKIGTGEGNQAFSHGLYFAENPDVARDYRRRLSGWGPGGKRPADSNEQRAVDWVMGFKRQGDTWDKAYDQTLAGLRDAWLEGDTDPVRQADRLKMIDTIRGWKEQGVGLRKTGNLYQVDINDSHISDMLDWDKKIAEQPQSVRQFAYRMGINPSPYSSFTGADLYRRLVSDEYYRRVWTQTGAESSVGMSTKEVEKLSAKIVSDQMEKAGIPGVRYLDRTSRRAGEGTSNFVVFNPDKSVKMLKRIGPK